MDGMFRKVLGKLFLPLAGLAALLVYGTLTFSIIEGLDWFDSLYWTVTVLSTVGFGDITPRTLAGKVVFMSLAVFGLVLYGYILSSLTSVIAGEKLIGVLSEVFAIRRKVDLEGHAVIVDWNRLSRYIYEELKANKIDVVVVVREEELGRELAEEGKNVVVGSYTREETLQKAGVEKARAVILAQEDATDRLITLLKVKKLSKGAEIIVVSHEDEMEDVFLQAGATRVANISDIGGRLVASYVFEPNVAEALLDLAEAESGLDIVERRLPESLDGKTLSELREMGMRGLPLIVKRGEHKYYYPEPSFTLRAGDLIVLIGLREDLDEADKILLKAR